ncbi:MAG: single-stranded DNA-binding protein, partial [Terriglobia bacterium]
MYYNITILVGYLGSDAEQRETKSGAKYTVLSLATKRSWKNAQGEYESRTYWHRAVAWNRLAEFAATLKKGMHVQLVGQLRTRVYEKECGNHKKFIVKQHVCEIALQTIPKLDRRYVDAWQEHPAPDADPTELPAEPETDWAAVPTEDIPF